MCGIVGYVGDRSAYDILIKGLHRLEYRGYDSAGVALVSPTGKLNVYKSRGKVSNLEHYCKDKDTAGGTGIAHTRWATHGEPSDRNAHPHFSEDEAIALVHNGTIENYKVLKDALIQNGCKFQSETDTEVLVQLIEYIRTHNDCTLIEAVKEALRQVVGAYAIAVIEKDNPDTIIAARKSSPLVIGIGEGEMFLASDATPIVEYTKNVVYVKDDEIAIISKTEPLKLVKLNNEETSIDVNTLEFSISQL
ncbi:MAG: class II glutamine amidotransferase, partial [Muribaculaceae bacterium]|nr:class II glutamine amidotransferase [Muribaculaceae bacterium]